MIDISSKEPPLISDEVNSFNLLYLLQKLILLKQQDMQPWICMIQGCSGSLSSLTNKFHLHEILLNSLFHQNGCNLAQNECDGYLNFKVLKLLASCTSSITVSTEASCIRSADMKNLYKNARPEALAVLRKWFFRAFPSNLLGNAQ